MSSNFPGWNNTLGLLRGHAKSLPHLREESADDEEGEGSGGFIHMCFSYKAAYGFQVDVGQIKLIRSLLMESKRNFWAISSEVAIRQAMALH